MDRRSDGHPKHPGEAEHGFMSAVTGHSTNIDTHTQVCTAILMRDFAWTSIPFGEPNQNLIPKFNQDKFMPDSNLNLTTITSYQ